MSSSIIVDVSAVVVFYFTRGFNLYEVETIQTTRITLQTSIILSIFHPTTLTTPHNKR
jgi:hypothetical protein